MFLSTVEMSVKTEGSKLLGEMQETWHLHGIALSSVTYL